MAESLGILNYQPQSGAGLRWGRIVAAAILLLAAAALALFSQVVNLFVMLTSSLSSLHVYVYLNALPTLVSTGVIVAAGILLALSHHAPPRGTGLSMPQQIGILLLVAFFIVIALSVVLNLWPVYAGSSSPALTLLLQGAYFCSTALWLALLVAICLYMRRIARLVHREGLFWLTLVCAALSAVIRLTATGFAAILWLSPSIYFSNPLVRNINPVLGAASALLHLVYWPAVLYVARSSARSERRNSLG